MATIITREVGTTAKGSPLTNAEIDNNFINLNREVSYAGPSIAPTLNLDFANSKTVDPRISFSRDSKATYYDGKATVKAEENLLTYSQDITNASWGKANTTVSADSATSPTGDSTADTITASAGTGVRSELANNAASFAAITPYTYSVYLKQNTHKYVQIYNGTGTSWHANFDLTVGAGAVGATGGACTASIVDSGNGWFRCIVVITTPTVSDRPVVALVANSSGTRAPTWSPAGTESIYIWGAQLEQRSQATAYTPTTTSPITNYIPVLQTAASNAARIDHDPVTGECKGLLIEEQRTNLLSYSSDFNAPDWGKAESTVSSNCAVAPDGTLTADKFTENTSASFHGLYWNSSWTTLGGQSATFSVYVKAAGRSKVTTWIDNGAGTGITALFDLVALTSSVVRINTPFSNAATSIQPAGNGWFRCSVSATNSGTSVTAWGQTRIYLYKDGGGISSYGDTSYVGDGASGVYLWGAQLESGTFPTSYIPTALTYSGRASVATYRGDDGYLKTAQVGEARYERNAQGGKQLLLEGAGTNLLTASDRFDDGAWVRYYNSNVTPNVGVSPDGLISADLVTFAANGGSGISRNIYSSPGTYTISVYAKTTSGTKSFRFYFYNSTDGVVSSANFTATTSWQRFTFTGTQSVATSSWYIANATTEDVGAVLVWGAQLETGSVATSYMPSVDTFTGRDGPATYFDSTGVLRTAPANAPRYGYGYDASRAKWVSAGLLAEAQAANLHIYSAGSSMISGVSGGSYALDTSIVAPDGNTGSVVKLIASGTNQEHYWEFNYALPENTPVGTQTTYSVFVKAGTQQLVSFRTVFSNGNNDISSVFDLTNGNIVAIPNSHSNVQATALPNGWYRISLTLTVFSLIAARGLVRFNVPGTSVNNYLYVWGAQAENGPVLTSYIPTSGSQVTRAADSATSVGGTRAADVYLSSQATRLADAAKMEGTNFSSWYRRGESTTFVESTLIGIGQYAMYPVNVYNRYTGTTVGYSSPTNLRGLNSDASNTVNVDLNLPTTGSTNKTAIAVAANNAALSVNGAISSVDTSCTPPDATELGFLKPNFETIVTGAGYLRKVAIYPKRLSNTELQALTVN